MASFLRFYWLLIPVVYFSPDFKFNMKRFYFNNNKQPAMRLLPNAGFFLKFSKNDRRWYTKNKISDSLRPSIGSPAVPFVEMKSADTTGLCLKTRLVFNPGPELYFLSNPGLSRVSFYSISVPFRKNTRNPDKIFIPTKFLTSIRSRFRPK